MNHSNVKNDTVRKVRKTARRNILQAIFHFNTNAATTLVKENKKRYKHASWTPSSHKFKKSLANLYQKTKLIGSLLLKWLLTLTRLNNNHIF